MNMTLPPDHLRHIDLTARLVDLKSSLSPSCKLFQAAPPLYVCRRSGDEPARWIVRLFVAFIIINAAVVLAYLVASIK